MVRHDADRDRREGQLVCDGDVGVAQAVDLLDKQCAGTVCDGHREEVSRAGDEASAVFGHGPPSVRVACGLGVPRWWARFALPTLLPVRRRVRRPSLTTPTTAAPSP